MFGLRGPSRTACAQALQALAGIAVNVRRLSGLLEAELHRPIRFAAGLHCGIVVVGEIGFRDHVSFTALGDPANVAARLQDLAKDLGCEAVVTDEVLDIAGLRAEALASYQARVRGRAGAVPVRLLKDTFRDLAAVTTV
jgi:adenylate cyclase